MSESTVEEVIEAIEAAETTKVAAETEAIEEANVTCRDCCSTDNHYAPMMAMTSILGEGTSGEQSQAHHQAKD